MNIAKALRDWLRCFWDTRDSKGYRAFIKAEDEVLHPDVILTEEQMALIKAFVTSHRDQLTKRTSKHDGVLKLLLRTNYQAFFKMIRQREYYPAQYMAEAISIKEGVTIVIWGIERLDNIKLASGIEYKYGDEVDSDRCIHIFQRVNHFTSLIPTGAPPPPKYGGALASDDETQSSEDEAAGERQVSLPPQRTSARLAEQRLRDGNQHEIPSAVPIHPRAPSRPVASARDDSDSEPDSDADEEPGRASEAYDWRKTLLDWRYGFAKRVWLHDRPHWLHRPARTSDEDDSIRLAIS